MGRLVRYFLKLGSLGFGGPIALVGYMHRDLVEQRGWFSDDEYRQGLALAQTMPGPLAAQLAMWMGFLTRGIVGSAAVAVAFVAPPFLLVTAAAVIYVENQGSSVVHALFRGVGPAIVAIVAIASVKLARTTNRRDPLLWAIAAGVCTVTVIAGAEWHRLATNLIAQMTPALPGHVYGAPDVNAGHVVSGVVSAESDRVTASLEMDDLLEDAHVRAVVREE